MSIIVQPSSPSRIEAQDVFSTGGLFGGTTLITNASGSVSLGSLRQDETVQITSVGATTLELPPLVTLGAKLWISSSVSSVGNVTVQNSTPTVFATLRPGQSVRLVRTETPAEVWNITSATSFSASGPNPRIATFTAVSDGAGNGTLDISSLGLAAPPLAVIATAYSPANESWRAAVKAKTATTVTYETWDHTILVVLASTTATKQANVTVDFTIFY